MRSFKEYVQTKPTPVFEGIAHLEDLPVDEFIDSIENLNRMIATQKLDGYNLWVGVDDAGKFYTSREGKKKGARFYAATDYDEDVPAYDGFRAAHRVLAKHASVIKGILKPGEVVELEIVFGRQPNAVVYGSGGYNYIAFLRALDSTPQERVTQLTKALDSTETTVKSLVHDTPDGRSIVKTQEPLKWKFTRSAEIDPKQLKSVNLKKELQALRDFLQKTNKEAKAVSGDELKTNYDLLNAKGGQYKELKKILNDKLTSDFKLNIKNTLLQRFVRDVKPHLQDKEVGNDEAFGIEGVVFLDPKTQKQFKLVDKDIFTAINKFNYDARSKVSGAVKTDDPLANLDMRGGLFGDAKIRIGRLFNIKGLTTQLQLKRALRKFKGSHPQETVTNMAKSLHQLSFGAAKKKIEAIVTYSLTELEGALNSFKDNVDKYKLKLKTGKTISYTPEVKRRTLMTFAETKRDLERLREAVNEGSGMGDLIIAMFGRQIKEIHQEVEEE